MTQTSDRALTLGNRGETLVDHYSFYAAFATPDEYRLVAGSKTLGTIPITQPLAPGSHLIFAGRCWEVRRIDDTARVIELTHARGGQAPETIWLKPAPLHRLQPAIVSPELMGYNVVLTMGSSQRHRGYRQSLTSSIHYEK